MCMGGGGGEVIFQQFKLQILISCNTYKMLKNSTCGCGKYPGTIGIWYVPYMDMAALFQSILAT